MRSSSVTSFRLFGMVTSAEIIYFFNYYSGFGDLDTFPKTQKSEKIPVNVVHDLELLRYMFFVVQSNDSFNFPLGLIKYIVIVLWYNNK